MTRPHTWWALAGSGLLALAACACGSTPANSGATTSTAPTASSNAPTAAASRAAIEKAFKTLFDLADPSVPPKLAVVQDGQSIKAAMTSELSSPLAKKAAGAVVSSIQVKSGSACQTEALSSPCALVTYSIVSPSNKPLLANSKGFAVYVSSKWLVSKVTICTLLTLANGNKTPAGC